MTEDPPPGWRQRIRPALVAAAASVVRLVRQIVAAAVTAEAAAPPQPSTGSGRSGRLREHARTAAPVVVAVVLGFISAADLNTRNDVLGRPVADAVITLVAILAAAPMALLRRAPLASFRASVIAGVVATALVAPILDDLPFVAVTAFAVPAGAFVAVTRAREEIAYGVGVCAAIGLVVVANMTEHAYPDMVWVASVFTVAAALVYAATVRSRGQAQGALVAEEARTAEQRAARAVLEERTRIARELHDVVGHHMSAIAIQAEAAPLRHGDDAAALTTELSEIRTTALDSLAEMRRILGVLRDDTTGAALSPTPGLDDLDALVTTARAAGLTVTVEELGTPVPLPTAVGVSAYRIIQESLSNAMRHAPGSSVALTIAHRTDPPVLSLEIHNSAGTGDPVPPDGTPHGLVGMRERAAVLGGDLHAGPAADGGFLVQARLPLEAG